MKPGWATATRHRAGWLQGFGRQAAGAGQGSAPEGETGHARRKRIGESQSPSEFGRSTTQETECAQEENSPVPPSNSKPSTELASRGKSDSGSDPKSGRGKPSKDSAPAAKNVFFEPFEKRAYDMSYACLLIPRNPEHELTGKVADFIEKAIADICKTFGWRVSVVQVRPAYFQWVLSATVSTAPTICIRTIRDQTSKGILAKFKQFRDKTPYQDFWAPGYMVLVSTETHPQSIIDEFITLTRQQQGLPRQGR